VWTEVIKFLGGSAILLGAVAWLIRSLTTHMLNKDLENFKHSLKTESDNELTMLKARLEIENTRQQIKLSVLQVRRLEVLEELYKRLVAFSAEADCLAVEPLHDDNEELKAKADKFIDKYFDFYTFFEQRAFFFSSSVEKQIKDLHTSHFNAAISLTYQDGEQFNNAVAKFKRESQSITSESHEIRDHLAADFRALLDVES
jgi:hypothetical protein